MTTANTKARNFFTRMVVKAATLSLNGWLLGVAQQLFKDAPQSLHPHRRTLKTAKYSMRIQMEHKPSSVDACDHYNTFDNFYHILAVQSEKW